jgi:hypothetical protein
MVQQKQIECSYLVFSGNNSGLKSPLINFVADRLTFDIELRNFWGLGFDDHTVSITRGYDQNVST